MKISLFTVSIYILLVFMPWSSFIIKELGGGVTMFVYIPILIVMVFLLLKTDIKFNEKITAWFFLFIPYILLVNLIYGDDLLSAFKLPITMLLLLTSFLITVNLTLTKRLDIDKLFIFAVYQLMVVVLFLIIDKLNGVEYYTYDEEAITGGIAGNISKYASILFPLVAIFSYTANYTFSFIYLIAVLITLRRSALIGAIIYYFIYLAPKTMNISVLKKNILKILGIFVFIALLYNIMDFKFLDSFLATLETRYLDLTEGTGSGRSTIWTMAIDLYLSYDTAEILFGHPMAFTSYLEMKTGMAIGAHSDILDFLCNYGAVGLILYLLNFYAIFSYFFQKIKNYPNEAMAGISLTAGILFLVIVTGGYFVMLNLMFFVFIGFLTGTIKLKEREADEEISDH